MRLLGCLIIVHLIDGPVLIVSRRVNKIAEFDNRRASLWQPLMRLCVGQTFGSQARYGIWAVLLINLLNLSIRVHF
jgi:hypothetical protein